MLLCKHFSAHVKKRCFLILHGSVLTHARRSETFWYPEVRNSLLINLVQKLSKSVNICKSYCKQYTGTFLWTTVYWHHCDMLLLLDDDDDERITACDSTLGSPFCPFSPSLPGSPASPWSHRSSRRCNTAITLIAVCCSSCFYMPILRVVSVGGSRGTSPPPTGSDLPSHWFV